MEQLQQQQKDKIRKTLENEIGRGMDEGVQGHIIRNIDISNNEDVTGFTVEVALKCSRLKLLKLPFTALSVRHEVKDGAMDTFTVNMSTSDIEEKCFSDD